MKNIILYGAGKRGKKIADLLKRKNIIIAGFCDSNISGQKIEWGGGNAARILVGVACGKQGRMFSNSDDC